MSTYYTPILTGAAATALVINNPLQQLDNAIVELSRFNVKSPEWGATGDGVTDDFAAIQNAVEACKTAGGGFVAVPRGAYFITDSIDLTDCMGVTFAGAGKSYSAGTTIKTTSDIPLIRMGNNAGVATYYCQHNIVRNMRLLGSGVASGLTNQIGILIEGGTGNTWNAYNSIDQMYIVSMGGDGIKSHGNAWLNWITRTQIDHCGGHGIKILAEGNGYSIRDCQAAGCGGSGIYIDGATHVLAGETYYGILGGSISNSEFETNTLYGTDIEPDVFGFTLTGNYWEQNYAGQAYNAGSETTLLGGHIGSAPTAPTTIDQLIWAGTGGLIGGVIFRAGPARYSVNMANSTRVRLLTCYYGSGTTDNIYVSGATNYHIEDHNGHIGMNVLPSTAHLLDYEESISSGSGAQNMSSFHLSASQSGATNYAPTAVFAHAENIGAGGITNNMTAMSFRATQSGAGLIALLRGMTGIVSINGNGNVTLGKAIEARAPFIQSGAGVITTQYGVGIENQGSANVTNAYGLYIESQTGAGTSNYAIYTNAGTVRFGGMVTGTMDTMTYGSTISLDVTLGNLHKTTTVHATGNATINASAAGTAGQHIWVLVINDVTTNKTITWGTHFNPSAATLVGTTSKASITEFVSDGINFYEVARTLGL